jgi:nucleotide-binding universal stress UspA family protein
MRGMIAASKACMETQSKIRTVILAAVEPSAVSDQVVHTAGAMARIVPGGELHFVHVVDPGPPYTQIPFPLSDYLAEGREYLTRVAAAAEKETTGKIVTHLAVGIPAKRIVQVAEDLNADLVIVGTHDKRGIERVLMGSVSSRVLAAATCPVLLARVKATPPAAPEIEPGCPDCLEQQRTTFGEKLWCERHSKRHVHGRLHYSVAEGFANGSILLQPDR